MIKLHTEIERAQQWIDRYQSQIPQVACIVGLTETALIPGISAAGKTPADRAWTAHADAEFLCNGVQESVTYPLPPLIAGASPVLISRAVIEGFHLPVQMIDAGLAAPLSVPYWSHPSAKPASCVSTGQAMPIAQVKALFEAGLQWGKELSHAPYLILGECVVGGTTTALAVLLGLGIDADGKVNSSHPSCNHAQKQQIAKAGLDRFWATEPDPSDPEFAFQLLAAVGDPMQPVIAGMTIAASNHCGILLAGGTQMLAVYAVTRSIAQAQGFNWRSDNVVVGTTQWVAADPTGNTIELANLIGKVALIATELNFQTSHYEALRAYEQGFVKEGVGAGGCAIAATMIGGWTNDRLVHSIEALLTNQESNQESLRKATR